MSEAVKLFKAKVKELAAFVESNEADSYLSPDFLARLDELRELTAIIKIDLAKERKAPVPIFAPNSVYVPVAPEENLAPFVAEEAPAPKVKTKQEEITPELQAVVEKAMVEEDAKTVEKVVDAKDTKDATVDEAPAEKAVEPTPEKPTKAKPAKN